MEKITRGDAVDMGEVSSGYQEQPLENAKTKKKRKKEKIFDVVQNPNTQRDVFLQFFFFFF